MNIRLCIVGDRSRDDEIYKRLRAAGLPISDQKVEQVDFTANTAEQLAELPKTDPEKLARIHRRTGRQISDAASQRPHYAYADREYPDQSGLNAAADDTEARITASFVRVTKGHVNAATSLWNCFGIYNGLPVTTQSSIDTFHAVDKHERMDWVCINGYIRKHIDTGLEALEFANRLTSAITIGRDLADGREIMVAWQGLCRLKDNKTEPLTHRDVFAWWQTIAVNNADVLWWFRTGDDGEQTDARIDDAITHAPTILDAIQSVEIK